MRRRRGVQSAHSPELGRGEPRGAAESERTALSEWKNVRE